MTQRTPASRLRRTALLALSVLVLGAASPAAAQEEPVLLRLKPHQGQADTYRFESELTLETASEMPQAPPRQTIRTRMVVRQAAETVGEETIDYVSEIEDYEVDLEIPGMDSTTRERVKQGAEQAEGARFRLSVTPTGRVTELDLGELAATGQGSNQLEQTLRQMGFPYFPDRPVSAGESWSHEQSMDWSGMGLPIQGDLVTESRSTLEELTREGDSTVARILVESTFAFEPAGGGQGWEIELSGSSAQRLRFDVTAGRLLGGRGSQDFVFTIRVPSQQTTITMNGSGQSTAVLVEG